MCVVGGGGGECAEGAGVYWRNWQVGWRRRVS